ncbi:hypothetical protein SAMN05660657_03212 [Geodermatophilus amargosae]|uniref:Uncharacterized protein n=1 Tax=Geodermatophilus amargosae TaxID=1296565 RepID=A0A1I7B0N8_9ACTN|nr:hypothetical protein SAMN05660657_03212 [Geodermatophilus amargosae]
MAVDQHDAEGTSRQPADGEQIGFYCPVCGYLTAQDRQPASAPTCAGSKARTGKQHEPTQMRILPFD